MITLTVNKVPLSVEDGTTVAAAVFAHGAVGFRRAINGESRGPLCGMGICFECRVTIDGVKLLRSCNILATNGMEVATDE